MLGRRELEEAGTDSLTCRSGAAGWIAKAAATRYLSTRPPARKLRSRVTVRSKIASHGRSAGSLGSTRSADASRCRTRAYNLDMRLAVLLGILAAALRAQTFDPKMPAAVRSE